jgi:hypothetical protein
VDGWPVAPRNRTRTNSVKAKRLDTTRCSDSAAESRLIGTQDVLDVKIGVLANGAHRAEAPRTGYVGEARSRNVTELASTIVHSRSEGVVNVHAGNG